MKRVAPITFEFVYLETMESIGLTEIVYNRLLRQAWKNLILDLQSTQKYTDN